MAKRRSMIVYMCYKMVGKHVDMVKMHSIYIIMCSKIVEARQKIMIRPRR